MYNWSKLLGFFFCTNKLYLKSEWNFHESENISKRKVSYLFCMWMVMFLKLLRMNFNILTFCKTVDYSDWVRAETTTVKERKNDKYKNILWNLCHLEYHPGLNKTENGLKMFFSMVSLWKYITSLIVNYLQAANLS